MTVPNALSLIRLVSVLPFVHMVFEDRFMAALVIVLFAGMLDFLDGWLARSCNQESKLGAVLDPIADKVLATAVFLSLFFKDLVPFWLVALFLLREIQMVAGYFHLRRRLSAGFKVRPLKIGKVNVVLQIALALTVIANRAFVFNADLKPFFYFAALFTTVTIAIYFKHWLKLSKTH